MIINKKLRTGDLKIDNYIEELEQELLKKENSSIDKFIRSADKVAKVLAKDLEFLAEGDIESCRLLNSDKDDKTIDRIFMMLKNNDLFAQISQTAETLIPEVHNEAQDLKIKIEEEDNPFEKMQQRVKTKLNVAK